MAPDLVPLIFGDKWYEAIVIYGAIRSTGNPIGSLLLANWGFYWNLGLFFYVPLGIFISMGTSRNFLGASVYYD